MRAFAGRRALCSVFSFAACPAEAMPVPVMSPTGARAAGYRGQLAACRPLTVAILCLEAVVCFHVLGRDGVTQLKYILKLLRD